MKALSNQKDLLRFQITIGAVVMMSIMIGNGIVETRSVNETTRTQAIVTHSLKVIDELDHIELLIKDVETSTRGYIITRKDEYLEPYRKAAPMAETITDHLESLLSDNPVQHKLALELGTVIADKLKMSKEYVVMGSFDQQMAMDLVKEGRGKALMDKIRAIAATLRENEERLLAKRDEVHARSVQNARLTLFIGLTANILLLTLLYVSLVKSLRNRRKLELAYEELNALESTKESLTAMLIHDLRSPLSSLIMAQELLATDILGELNEKQRDVVVKSQTSGERLLRLINELLDISKLEEGELRVNIEKVPLREALEPALAHLQGVRSYSSKILVDDEVKNLLVCMDCDLVTRVVMNLLSNAMDFSPPDKPIVVSADLNDQSEVLISVKDEGRGIPPEEHERIFDKFSQVGKKSGRVGTGLGLTFCRLAVEAHGGRIWVESEPGRGSTFTFLLPNRCQE